MTGVAPSYLSEGFKVSDISYGTRRRVAGSLELPRFKTSVGLNSFQYTAIKEWNNVPINIRSVTNVNVFKQQIKLYLFNMLTDREDDVYVYK